VKIFDFLFVSFLFCVGVDVGVNCSFVYKKRGKTKQDLTIIFDLNLFFFVLVLHVQAMIAFH
jgi:hypothetical protein